MLTFFTIKSYFALAIVTLALHGLGFSFVYATAISAAQVRPVLCTMHCSLWSNLALVLKRINF